MGCCASKRRVKRAVGISPKKVSIADTVVDSVSESRRSERPQTQSLQLEKSKAPLPFKTRPSMVKKCDPTARKPKQKKPSAKEPPKTEKTKVKEKEKIKPKEKPKEKVKDSIEPSSESDNSSSTLSTSVRELVKNDYVRFDQVDVEP